MQRDAKSFVKWAGGKGQLLNTLNQMFPKQLKNGNIETYIEPFIGGGAVLFHILQKYNVKKAIINDINKELINCYRCIKENYIEIVNRLKILEREYLQADKRGDYYYKVRDRFNSVKLNSNIDYEKCADFIFLNRTCYNGLYRVNKNGYFNVPHGRYKNPIICDENNLRLCSVLLQRVEIHCGDFSEVLQECSSSTFVYFDPPYRPLLATSSFVDYYKNGFDDRDQIKLSKVFKELNDKGCILMLSNSDPKNVNEKDNFFDDLYKGFDIKRVSAKRMINCQSDKRGSITEIVVRNYL